MTDDADDSSNPSGFPAPPEDARARAREPLSVDEALARDDVDAALRFFAAAKEDFIAAGDEGARVGVDDALTLDFSRFRARRIRTRLLALVDELAMAIAGRDQLAVWAVLDTSDACRCFPVAVREEALSIAALPRVSVRQPVRLYHYHHTLMQLGDEPIEHDVNAAHQPLMSAGDPAAEHAARDIALTDRRPPRGGPRNGSDRRRSGSR